MKMSYSLPRKNFRFWAKWNLSTELGRRTAKRR